jgi:acetyl-CoA carboxylase carboxyltransferase component
MIGTKDILDTVKGRRNRNRTPNNNDHGYVRQKTQGKLWVRDRIFALVDKQSFREIGSTAGNGKYDDKGNNLDYNPANFVFGTAKLNTRDVVVAADDFSIRAGHADGAVWGKSVSIKDGVQHRSGKLNVSESFTQSNWHVS